MIPKGMHAYAAVGLVVLAFGCWKLVKKFWLSRPGPVSRFEQGARPHAYGDVWDAMTPEQRREAFAGDILLAFFGVLLLGLFIDAAEAA